MFSNEFSSNRRKGWLVSLFIILVGVIFFLHQISAYLFPSSIGLPQPTAVSAIAGSWPQILGQNSKNDRQLSFVTRAPGFNCYFVYLPVVVNSDGGANSGLTDDASSPTVYCFPSLHFPLGYGPYRDGQAPGGATPSPAEIDEDMGILEQETHLIRTYSACDEEIAAIPGIASGYNTNVYQGAWIGSSSTINDQEMACFATLVAENENIIAGVIGNEALLRGDLSESALISYINQANGVPVTTAEPWGIWCNELNAKPRCQSRPSLGTAVDFILAHSHPYWESLPIEHAAAHVVSTYITLRALYPDKDVVIGETGWPTCGQSFGNAVPSLENQRQFIEELWKWANLYDVPVLYFEAFDEAWKAGSEGEVGGCWGLYNSDRTPKHTSLDWTIPAPEPPFTTTPTVYIEHPRDIVSMETKSNCGIPVFGRVYGAEPGWQVKIEVFTNQWWVQDKWYLDGLAPIVDGMWSVPEAILAGTGQYNNHKIRATLVDELGSAVTDDLVENIVRTNSCSP